MALSEEAIAIRSLASRLVGYPIISLIQRIVCSSYTIYAEGSYGNFLFVVDKVAADPKKSVTVLIVLLYAWAIIAPSLIIMDTIFLLYFQKGAPDACRYYLSYAVSVLTCGYISQRSIPEVLLHLKENTNAPSRATKGDEIFTQEGQKRMSEMFNEMDPSTLMGIIVHQRAERESSMLLDNDFKASFGSQLSEASSNRESGILLLDYMFDTSDEPGVSPEEATRKRMDIRRGITTNQRGSKANGGAANSDLRSISPEATMHANSPIHQGDEVLHDL